MVGHYVHWRLAGRTLAPLELNEVMYTLELGIVTAGFLFMVLAALATLVFGRFFCSWACHILALQDLCAWLLRKVGIRTKPLRSRFLALVPFGALFYMFVWPQLVRLAEGGSLPRLHIAADEAGWASFLTSDFTRNLPGPWVTLATFAVCGFLIVYLMGSRSFCRNVCPYGALFALADKVAPGRIVATGECEACALCTAACTSGVDVHKELAAFGTVVDSQCLKDLDCLNACPNGAIGYGFRRPSLFVRGKRERSPRPRHAFSGWEEVTLAGAFLATLIVLRGLYGVVPFLLALGLALVLAFSLVIAWRAVTGEGARLGVVQLKLAGRWTGAGRAFLTLVGLAWALTAHSTFVRYHEVAGERAHERVSALAPGDPARVQALEAAQQHLRTAQRWGLLPQPDYDRRLVILLTAGGDPAGAQPHLRRILEDQPDDLEARLRLAQILQAGGRPREASAELDRLIADGAAPEAATALHAGRSTGVRASAHGLRGAIRLAAGDRDGALEDFGQAVELRPDLARAHFELGRLLLAAGRRDEGLGHLRRAAELDPAYGRALETVPQQDPR
jgi:polyferredoxin/Flp pilus assembly protein TadD